MFESRYKKAYDTIVPSEELLFHTIAHIRDRRKTAKGRFIVKASFAAAAVVCLFTAVPVCAAHIPAFYEIVEYLSPALADRLVPIEKSCTSQGITMQVEAVHIEGNEAEIIISLQDAKDSTQDLVHGEMDLFDSYNLSDYTNDSTIGGCHFLTYDAQSDKAYFQVNVQSDNIYRSGKMQFRAYSILCGKSKDTREVDLSEIVYSAETKQAALSGSGGLLSEDMLPDSLKEGPGTEDDPRPGVNVLNLCNVEDCAADDFTVTGIAYMDGVLRVQMCMGDNWRADRHVELFLKDSDGNERYSDRSVSWHEDIGETSYQFYEFWYLENIENIADYSMYGIFHASGELIKGDWKITFRME